MCTSVSGLEIEQCSIRRRFLVPDDPSPRFAWHTSRNRRVDLWRRFLERVSWV